MLSNSSMAMVSTLTIENNWARQPVAADLVWGTPGPRTPGDATWCSGDDRRALAHR